jgi:hypothetical protein
MAAVLVVGGEGMHGISSSSHMHPADTYAGVECVHHAYLTSSYSRVIVISDMIMPHVLAVDMLIRDSSGHL